MQRWDPRTIIGKDWIYDRRLMVLQDLQVLQALRSGTVPTGPTGSTESYGVTGPNRCGTESQLNYYFFDPPLAPTDGSGSLVITGTPYVGITVVQIFEGIDKVVAIFIDKSLLLRI